jgi:Cu/Ag efflux pump CusA
MAIAVAGGMTSSTLLTLLVIPVAYTLIDDLVEKVKVLWQRKNGEVYQPSD